MMAGAHKGEGRWLILLSTHWARCPGDKHSKDDLFGLYLDKKKGSFNLVVIGRFLPSALVLK